MKYMIVFLSLLIVVVVAAILFVQAELDEMTFGILVRLTIASFTLFINVKRTLLFFLGNELVRRASQPRRAARQQGDPFHYKDHHHHHCHHDNRLRHYHHHHHHHHPCKLTMKRSSLYPLLSE